MSEIQRWTTMDGADDCVEHSNGEYVLYADHVAREQELVDIITNLHAVDTARVAQVDALRAKVGGQRTIHAHRGCVIRTAGLVNGTTIDDRCDWCKEVDAARLGGKVKP